MSVDLEVRTSQIISFCFRFTALVPEVCSNHVLLAPAASLQLQTSRDGRAVYAVPAGQAAGTGGQSAVSKRGLVTSGRVPGTTVVLGTVEEEAGVLQQVNT